MTDFWLIAASLCALALAFLVIPLLLRRQQGDADVRASLNVELYRHREAELEAEHRQGLLSDEELTQQRQELQRNLLADAEASRSAGQGRQGAWLAWLFAALLPVAAVLVYQHLGSAQDVQIRHLMDELSRQDLDQTTGEQKLQELTRLLEDRILKQPDNLHYTAMLGQIYSQQQQYSAAAQHYRRLARQLGNDADAWAYLAQALYLANNRTINAEVKQAMDTALALNPHQETVLGLVGIDGFEKGDFATAITAWSKVLTVLEPDSEQATMLRSGIEQAKSRLLAQGGKMPESVTTAPAAAGPQLEVSVSLADKVKVPATATVFILAKATSGPPMPLAVKRLTVADLPVKVVLDDSTAMSPQLKLSAFPEVTVMARVSLSGTPMANSGDWQGQITPVPVKPGLQPLAIIIDQQVP